MKAYVKPMVLELEDIAEGIYAASGEPDNNENNNGGEQGQGTYQIEESDCWTIDVTSDQEDAGGYHTFRVSCVHSTSLQHISSATTIVLVFNQNVTKAVFEGFDAEWSGTTVKLVRTLLADSYMSGDNYNSLLQVWTDGDCKTLQVVSKSISCTKTVNVQGNGGDE